MPSVTVSDVDLDRLQRLAACMARAFSTELVVGLVGTLGSGKTTFAQALASELGVDPEDVTSPTFTLLCSYDARIAAGPIRLNHLDAYRLADEDEFIELGIEELLESEHTWTLIEWADRVKTLLPESTLWMTLDVAQADGQTQSPERRITLSTHDVNLTHALDTIARAMKSAT
jgi:tRNA threonylcarbamoyladenosine biosynthesis protein TsaE